VDVFAHSVVCAVVVAVAWGAASFLGFFRRKCVDALVLPLHFSLRPGLHLLRDLVSRKH
jgi:hypothetical protein